MALDLVLLGPPGAGKGTQAKAIALSHGIPHISTGDLFREAVSRGTPLGREAKGFMDRGDLVPDAVVCGMVGERLRQSDAVRGSLLDGFPRTIPQARALDRALAAMGRSVGLVISFVLDEETAIARLGGRLTCRQCGAQFQVTLRPPKTAGVCDACGAQALYVRDDDAPDAIARRMREYREKTAPLVTYYRGRGLLREVDASPSVDLVRKSLEAHLGGV